MDTVENTETLETVETAETPETQQPKKRRIPLALKIIIPVVLGLAIAVVATIFGVRGSIENREQEALRFLEGKTFVIEPSPYDYTPDYKFLSFQGGKVAYEYWEAGSTEPQGDITQYNPCQLDIKWLDKQACIEMYTGEYWQQLVLVDLLDDGSVVNVTYSEYDNKWETCTVEQVSQRREDRYNKKEKVASLTHQDIIDYLEKFYAKYSPVSIDDVGVKDGSKPGVKQYSFVAPGGCGVYVLEVDGVVKRVSVLVTPQSMDMFTTGELTWELWIATSFEMTTIIMLACQPEKDETENAAWHKEQFQANGKEESVTIATAEYEDEYWTYKYKIDVNQYVVVEACAPDMPEGEDLSSFAS